MFYLPVALGIWTEVEEYGAQEFGREFIGRGSGVCGIVKLGEGDLDPATEDTQLCASISVRI